MPVGRHVVILGRMSIPEKIGRYEIKSELGRGGMATVYRAFDPSFDREVAIKVLPREMLHDPQFRSRFERELKIIAGLEHPSIVPVYDVGDVDGQPYFVMRYMPGGSLADEIKKGNFSLEDTARIISRNVFEDNRSAAVAARQSSTKDAMLEVVTPRIANAAALTAPIDVPTNRSG